ncbi:MAG: IS3 family transposase [Steroidobacteraceae bacterium]
MGRRSFTPEFKHEAVKLVLERGVSQAQAARDLGLHSNVLRAWVRDARKNGSHAFPGRGKQRPDDVEVARLRRELAKAQAERDVLKKGHRLLREGTSMKFEFIAKHRGVWRTSLMCEALGVSRAGFYDWMRRPESRRSRENRQLLVQVRTSFEQSDRTYGSPRVWRDLRAWGFACGKHRVARLMLAAGLQARRKRRRLPFDLGARPEHAIAPNVLDRQFEATAPNQRWVADFTYIWTDEGWLYVAAVMDLFSRRIVGWSMSSQMTAQLVTDALLMAIWRRGRPQELLHHSDQGSQYTSELFQRLLADQGITCSMSRSGNVWDNSAMESFFSSLKTERVHRKMYRTRDEAKADVFDYVERFYNPRRRHSTIGYLSPADYEEAAGSA